MSGLREIELNDRIRSLALDLDKFSFDWLDAGSATAAALPVHPTSEAVCLEQAMTPGANLVLNGTHVAYSSSTRGATIPVLCEMAFLAGNVADIFSAEVRGFNHLGENAVEYVNKPGVLVRYARMVTVWSHISSIKILSASGPTGLVRVGTGYSNSYTTMRLPIPWHIRDASEIAAVMWRRNATGYGTSQPAFASIPATGVYPAPGASAINFGAKTFLVSNGALTQAVGTTPNPPPLHRFAVVPNMGLAQIFAGVQRG